MQEYTIQKHPQKKTGYWTQAAGYLYWHRTREAADIHAARITWTDQVSVWRCLDREVA